MKISEIPTKTVKGVKHLLKCGCLSGAGHEYDQWDRDRWLEDEGRVRIVELFGNHCKECGLNRWYTVKGVR